MFRSKRDTNYYRVTNPNNNNSDRKTWIEKEMLIDNAVYAIPVIPSEPKKKKWYKFERIRIYTETDKKLPNQDQTANTKNTRNDQKTTNRKEPEIKQTYQSPNHQSNFTRNTDLKNKIRRKLSNPERQRNGYKENIFGNLVKPMEQFNDTPVPSELIEAEEVTLRPKPNLIDSYSFDNDDAALIHALILEKFDKKIKEHHRKSYKRQSFKDDVRRWTLY